MKKILLLLAIIAAFSWQGIAQVSSYGFTASTGTFDTLVGGTNVSAIEDDYAISGSLPIGFTFNFDGTNYTDVKVGSDGFISFNSSASAQTTNNLDGISAANRPLIAPLWDDHAGEATGGVSYASYLTTGTAPNRIFTFEWKNWEWNYGSSDPVITFQVKLYETSNVVEFAYKQETGSVNSGSASIGMTGVSSFVSLDGSGATPSTSTTTETSNISAKPATGQIYTFTPPSCPAPNTLTVASIAATSVDLGWTEAGAAALWQYEYDTTGFTQGTGTIDTTSANPKMITGLSQLTDYQFYVRAICGAGDSSNWTGPFSFTTLPTCPSPDTLAVTNVTTTSANLVWSEMGSATLWQYEYDTTGFTQGTGNIDTTSSNPYMVSGLTANTDYQFYVRAVCGAGDTSIWVGPYSFSTICNAFSVPFQEGFNSTSPSLGCWTIIDNNSDGDTWAINTSSSYVSEGDQSATMYTDYNAGANDDYLVSPQLTLTGSERMRYWYRARSSGEPNDYKILVSTTTLSPSSFTDTLLVDTANSTTYAEKTIDLSSYTGNIYIAFYIPTGGLDGYYIYFDDFNVEAIPSCLATTDLNVTNVTSSTANIGWTENGTATLWQYEYDTAGFAQGTGTIDTTSSNPYSVTGLNADTDYEFYVRTVCGAGDTAGWVGPFAFSTLCNAFSIPFQEGFNSASPTLGCWTIIDNNADGDTWAINTSSSYVSEGDQSATMYTDYNAGANDDYLVSPQLTLTGNERLRYWYRARSTGEPNDYKILISTTSLDPSSFTDTLLVDTADFTTYAEKTIDISSYSGNVFIAFYIPTGGLDGYYIYFDDFNVEAIPTCPKPTDLTASNLGATSAMLGWTENGSATAWQIEWDTLGFTQGTGTLTPASSNPFSLGGLTVKTNYDYYVRAVCGVGDSSIWEGPYNFATTPDTIVTFPYTNDLESGLGIFMGLRDSAQSAASVDTVADNASTYGVLLTGNTSTGWSGGSSSATETQAFVDNSSHISGIDMVVDASTLTALELQYDLKQTYSYGDNYSWARVTVNGAQVGLSINPITDDSDPFTTISVDLSAYVGTTFNLSIEHSGKYNVANGSGGRGDDAYVDNVKLFVPMTATAAVDSNATCFGMSNGGATISPINGVLPYTFLWSNNATTASITGVTAGVYDVTVSDDAGDSVLTSVTITEPAQLVVSLGNDTSICLNGLLTLDAGAGFASYLWDNGVTTQTRIVNSTVPASNAYSVIVSDANGCNGYDTVNVDINAPVMPNLGNDTTICYDASLTLDAGTGFNSYLWDDATTLQTKDVVGASVGSAVHTMYVATTDANMCTGTDTIIVTVDAQIMLDLGNDTTVCSGTSFNLDAGSGYASYLWDDLTTMQTRTVATNAAGAIDYSVVVTTTAGCIGSSTMEVTGRAPVIVNLGPDTTIGYWGADTVYTLDAGTGFASYLWSDNVTSTQTFVVNKDNMGLIGVVVTDANGCMGTDTVRVDFLLSVPSFDVSTLKMYPNPASDHVNIEMSNFNNVDEVNVKFISITGEVVLRKQINVNGGSYQETFDVSNLATGAYFVQFEAKGEVVTRQFIIK